MLQRRTSILDEKTNDEQKWWVTFRQETQNSGVLGEISGILTLLIQFGCYYGETVAKEGTSGMVLSLCSWYFMISEEVGRLGLGICSRGFLLWTLLDRSSRYAGNGNARGVSMRKLMNKDPKAGTALRAALSISRTSPAGLGFGVRVTCSDLFRASASFPFQLPTAHCVPAGMVIIHSLPSNTSQRNQLLLGS